MERSAQQPRQIPSMTSFKRRSWRSFSAFSFTHSGDPTFGVTGYMALGVSRRLSLVEVGLTVRRFGGCFAVTFELLSLPAAEADWAIAIDGLAANPIHEPMGAQLPNKMMQRITNRNRVAAILEPHPKISKINYLAKKQRPQV